MYKINIPYDRPEKLSNPFRDFEEDELNKILNKADAELGWKELSCIFQGYLPAGKYEECAYFIPCALEFISQNKQGASLLDNLLIWIHENVENLKKDKLFINILDCFEAIFSNLISNYILDENRDGMKYPRGGDVILSIISGLNNNKCFNMKGDVLLQKYFKQIKKYEDAAWMLYLLYNHYSTATITSDIIHSWSMNQKIKEVACDCVLKKSVESDMLLEYWQKLLIRCGLI